MAVNRHYSAKAATLSKPHLSHEAPVESTLPTTQATTAMPANGIGPKKTRLTPSERKERNRKAAAQRRQTRKTQGICKDCPNRATKGHTRCPDCAEKHRIMRNASR